jgi:hypothetical protein
MMEISNKALMVLMVATIVISLGGAYISISSINQKLSSFGLNPITGFATIPNGTTTVTVNLLSSIKFSSPTVAFGSGTVNTSGNFNNCTLSTLGSNSGCTDFNVLTNGFTVENDGNANLTVELRSNISATDFIGIGSALFLWNVTVNESGSCVNTSSVRAVIEPNTSAGCLGTGNDEASCGSIFESVSTTNKVICPSLLFADSSDALNIDINISIPDDAPTGAKVAGLIVTGTAQP